LKRLLRSGLAHTALLRSGLPRTALLVTRSGLRCPISDRAIVH